MRVLSLDPGAERMGFAVIEGGKGEVPEYVASGIVAVERGDQKYQPYRLGLIESWTSIGPGLIERFEPEIVVNETIPPVGGGAFSSNGVQAQLAMTALTTFQAMVYQCELPVEQVSANTVKAKIGGAKSATKVKVRNGVYTFFPNLKEARGKEWTKVFDESDAIAIGLTYLGYTTR